MRPYTNEMLHFVQHDRFKKEAQEISLRRGLRGVPYFFINPPKIGGQGG